jgi:hypothetical protein
MVFCQNFAYGIYNLLFLKFHEHIIYFFWWVIFVVKDKIIHLEEPISFTSKHMLKYLNPVKPSLQKIVILYFSFFHVFSLGYSMFKILFFLELLFMEASLTFQPPVQSSLTHVLVSLCFRIISESLRAYKSVTSSCLLLSFPV